MTTTEATIRAIAEALLPELKEERTSALCKAVTHKAILSRAEESIKALLGLSASVPESVRVWEDKSGKGNHLIDAVPRQRIIEHCKELEVKFNWEVGGEVATGIRQFVERLPPAVNKICECRCHGYHEVRATSCDHCTPEQSPRVCVLCKHEEDPKAEGVCVSDKCVCHCEFPASVPETKWKCACGWKGVPSEMTVSNTLRTCPKCGASGGLILDSSVPDGGGDELVSYIDKSLTTTQEE